MNLRCDVRCLIDSDSLLSWKDTHLDTHINVSEMILLKVSNMFHAIQYKENIHISMKVVKHLGVTSHRLA